jgi:hypothetical protein
MSKWNLERVAVTCAKAKNLCVMFGPLRVWADWLEIGPKKSAVGTV